MSNNKETISADEFDRIFDEGKEDITQYLDLSSARRINQKPAETKARRVNVDFPEWMVEAMDREADRIGITRQAFIKVVVAERLGEFGRP
jgi:predicted DNA binding CopG/RHH family protein